jgi:hypothetical protein
MKKSTKFLVLGLALAVVISVGVVFAADKTTTTTTTATKTADKSTTTATTTVATVKLTQDDVTKIVVKAYADAKVVDVKLNGKIYIVKIQTAKGNRTLQIGGNTGKILKDTADVAPVASPAPKATAAPKTKSK